jgi:hypothetical protein
MSENTKTVVNLKGQLSKFSGIISKSFKKSKQKLIKEMLYGIQAAKDVKLSKIYDGSEHDSEIRASGTESQGQSSGDL